LRAIKPVRLAGRALLDTIERYRVPAWHLRGAERVSGAPLSIFFAGHLESKNYLAHLALREGYAEAALEPVWLWSAERRGACSGADISVIHARARAGRPASATLWSIPCWISLEVDIDHAVERMNSERVKSDVRRFRRHNLQCHATSDPAKLEWFYRTMYVPYVARTHGNRAMLTPWDEIARELHRCELLLIKKDDDYIAGEICHDLGDGCVRIWCMGVKDGDLAYVKLGAVASLYYHEIGHFRARGFRRLHYGATRPFLHDGVLKFKRKYGPYIVQRDEREFAVTLARLTPGTQHFLANNPFINEHDGAYHANFFALVAADCDRDAFEAEAARHTLTGIAAYRLYDLRAAAPALVQSIDADARVAPDRKREAT
jgi:hypothetical protein